MGREEGEGCDEGEWCEGCEEAEGRGAVKGFEVCGGPKSISSSSSMYELR